MTELFKAFSQPTIVVKEENSSEDSAYELGKADAIKGYPRDWAVIDNATRKDIVDYNRGYDDGDGEVEEEVVEENDSNDISEIKLSGIVNSLKVNIDGMMNDFHTSQAEEYVPLTKDDIVVYLMDLKSTIDEYILELD